MSGDELLDAVQALERLVDGGRARDAAVQVAGRLSVTDLQVYRSLGAPL